MLRWIQDTFISNGEKCQDGKYPLIKVRSNKSFAKGYIYSTQISSFLIRMEKTLSINWCQVYIFKSHY